MADDEEDDDEGFSSTLGDDYMANNQGSIVDDTGGGGVSADTSGIQANSDTGRDDYQGAVDDFLKNTSDKYGADIGEGDRERMMEYYDSAQRGQTTQAQIKEFNDKLTGQYQRRGASNQSGGGGVSGAISKMRGALSSGNAADQDWVSRELQTLLTSQGHDVKWEGSQVMIDGRPYTIGGNDPTKEWMPSGKSGYTPGEIGMEDIPNFTYDSLMQQMTNPQMDQFMSTLLANPESLDARTVESMKARSKDEFAEMDTQNREMLGGLGSQYGIEESPWMAKQQMQASRDRDAGLLSSNRNIDIEAARTNMADRRAAAGLGLQAGAQQQSKVMGAASTALARSAATGDRLALRESVNQQAAALNMRAEEVLAGHIQHRIGEMTKKYGIDVGSSDSRFATKIGGLINMKSLAQADRHFLEELSMRMSEFEGLERERGRGHTRWEEEHAFEREQQDWIEDQARRKEATS